VVEERVLEPRGVNGFESGQDQRDLAGLAEPGTGPMDFLASEQGAIIRGHVEGTVLRETGQAGPDGLGETAPRDVRSGQDYRVERRSASGVGVQLA